jgi:hypothetical protein
MNAKTRRAIRAAQRGKVRNVPDSRTLVRDLSARKSSKEKLIDKLKSIKRALKKDKVAE